MAVVKDAFAALALVVTAPAEADPVARWRVPIAEASARFGIPVAWIERVMRAESGGRTTLAERPIVSRAGAVGLMQLMPGTWVAMRTRLGLGDNPHAPRDNILAGTLYLRLMYDRFGYPGLFAAYNAGPQRYTEYLTSRRRLPGETLAYLAKVAGPVIDRRLAITAAPPPALFFPVRGDISTAPPPSTRSRTGLFIVLNRPAPSP